MDETGQKSDPVFLDPSRGDLSKGPGRASKGYSITEGDFVPNESVPDKTNIGITKREPNQPSAPEKRAS
jgi:hypothetical protein